MLLEKWEKFFYKLPYAKDYIYNEKLICRCNQKERNWCLLSTAEELIYDLGLDLEDIELFHHKLITLQSTINFHKEIKEVGIFIYKLSEKYRNESIKK